MGAILTKIDDPRDNLMKMTRDELYDYGKENGVEFPQGRDTPAFDGTSAPVPNMVDILRARGLPGRDKSYRQLGSPQPLLSDPPASYSNKILPKTPPPVPSPTWDRDVAEGVRAHVNSIIDDPASDRHVEVIEELTMGELRMHCKRRGIKMSRRDNMNTLRDKLRGQNAA
jgi:hypothetical protein